MRDNGLRTSFAAWHPVSVKHTLKHTLLDRVEIYIFRRDLSSHPAGRVRKSADNGQMLIRLHRASFGGLVRRVRDWLEIEVLTSVDGRICTSLIQSSKMGRAFRLMDTRVSLPETNTIKGSGSPTSPMIRLMDITEAYTEVRSLWAQQPSLLKHTIYSLAARKIPDLH